MIDYLASFTNTDGAAFPNTLGVNVTAPGAGDGTEFVKLFVDDIWGRAQALLDYAGLTPDGVTEAPGTAQFLTAIGRGFGVGPGIGVTYWKNGTPAANSDRVLLLQGQVIAIASYPLLVAACYVGDPSNGTAPAFYKTSDAGGTTRDTAGGFFVLPDTRAVSLKGTGNQTINTRVKSGPAFATVQEDALQNITGNVGASRCFDVLDATNTTNPFDINTKVTSAPGSGATATDVYLIDMDLSRSARTSTATRDCTIGTNFGITY